MPRAKKTQTIAVKTDTVKDTTPGLDSVPAAEPSPKKPRPVAAPAPSHILTVVTQSGPIDLKFNNPREVEHAFKQITFKCASGRAATVVSEGKEYTFCNVDYVIRDEPVQQ